MIKVKVDILPFGTEEDKYTVSEITIYNTTKVNKNDQHKYNYSIWVKDQYGTLKEYLGEIWHYRSDTIMILLSLIFKKLEKEIKKDNESEKYEDEQAR